MVTSDLHDYCKCNNVHDASANSPKYRVGDIIAFCGYIAGNTNNKCGEKICDF